MDQSLLSLVAGKHTAGDDNNISPEKIPYYDLSQIYHNYYFLSSAFQFPYIPSYNFPNNNIYLDDHIVDYYCSLTNQTFKKPRPEPEITPYQYFTPTLVLNNELPSLDDPYSLEHVITDPSFTNYSKPTEPNPVQQPQKKQESNRVRVNKEKMRIRRKNISDKTMYLKNLLPSRDKKMEMATVYAEASKYIKYLKAQIKVLEAMPTVGDNHGYNGSCSGSNFGGDESDSSGGDVDGCGGKLRKLKRGELLEVLVNSKSAQRMMCSIGFCVYSVEQKLLLKELDDKHLLSTDP
uniref:transcription factor bHLH117-like n=1 Tax=Erigeron canadensis TaxID=72917 RepID=UPI001CB9092A